MRRRLYLMANPMAQAAISLESRWPCVFIRASPGWSNQSELWPDHGGHPWQLVSGPVSHWDTPGSYLALCVPMLKVSSVSGAGNPVSSSYNSPIIVYNCAQSDSISMDRVRCRPSAGAYPVILKASAYLASALLRKVQVPKRPVFSNVKTVKTSNSRQERMRRRI